MWFPAFAIATIGLILAASLFRRQQAERSCVVCGEPLGVGQIDCPACNRGR